MNESNLKATQTAQTAGHTPGPWLAEIGTTAGSPIEVYVDENAPASGELCRALVALVHDGSAFADAPRQKKANAALIAAAPDLLAACEFGHDDDPENDVLLIAADLVQPQSEAIAAILRGKRAREHAALAKARP